MVNPWRAWVDRFSAKLAFFPPGATYTVVEVNSSGVQASSGQQWKLDSPIREIKETLTFRHTVKKLRTKPTLRGHYGADESFIVAAFIPYTSRAGAPAELTMLCSHGNAVDLGQMMPIYRELGQILKVNIMGYDYTGYGASTGVPSASQTYADIQRCMDCLVEDFGVPINRIVLYGQSVGSGPTAWLGAQEKSVAGVVLHSPLLSGVRVLHPNLTWWPSWADVFPNHLYVPHIEAPLLIMHGTHDEVIDIKCGQRLAKLAKNPFTPLWAQGYNHQNIEACREYVPHLTRFIAHVATQQGCNATAAASGQKQNSSRP